jgi:C4-dicarboxylate-specific signal transduction histidine kinase
MGEMAAGLAHELNQPLQAVVNYARGSVRRLLRRNEKDEELLSALRQISEEANRAAEIIRRVRGFVHKRNPQAVKVSVNGLIEEVVLLSKAEIQQRHAAVVFDLASDLPAVVGDLIQIEQVMLNLVRNGLEAMDEVPELTGDRRLWIKTERHGDGHVQVSVQDRGKGIAKNDLEKIFEPFFTTKPEGMGMGLAISRSIIQAHGGQLWAAANQDLGCTFHFTLPTARIE